jgi:hypothetical protein
MTFQIFVGSFRQSRRRRLRRYNRTDELAWRRYLGVAIRMHAVEQIALPFYRRALNLHVRRDVMVAQAGLFLTYFVRVRRLALRALVLVGFHR